MKQAEHRSELKVITDFSPIITFKLDDLEELSRESIKALPTFIKILKKESHFCINQELRKLDCAFFSEIADDLSAGKVNRLQVQKFLTARWECLKKSYSERTGYIDFHMGISITNLVITLADIIVQPGECTYKLLYPELMHTTDAHGNPIDQTYIGDLFLAGDGRYLLNIPDILSFYEIRGYAANYLSPKLEWLTSEELTQLSKSPKYKELYIEKALSKTRNHKFSDITILQLRKLSLGTAQGRYVEQASIACGIFKKYYDRMTPSEKKILDDSWVKGPEFEGTFAELFKCLINATTCMTSASEAIGGLIYSVLPLGVSVPHCLSDAKKEEPLKPLEGKINPLKEKIIAAKLLELDKIISNLILPNPDPDSDSDFGLTLASAALVIDNFIKLRESCIQDPEINKFYGKFTTIRTLWSKGISDTCQTLLKIFDERGERIASFLENEFDCFPRNGKGSYLEYFAIFQQVKTLGSSSEF